MLPQPQGCQTFPRALLEQPNHTNSAAALPRHSLTHSSHKQGCMAWSQMLLVRVQRKKTSRNKVTTTCQHQFDIVIQKCQRIPQQARPCLGNQTAVESSRLSGRIGPQVMRSLSRTVSQPMLPAGIWSGHQAALSRTSEARAVQMMKDCCRERHNHMGRQHLLLIQASWQSLNQQLKQPPATHLISRASPHFREKKVNLWHEHHHHRPLPLFWMPAPYGQLALPCKNQTQASRSRTLLYMRRLDSHHSRQAWHSQRKQP